MEIIDVQIHEPAPEADWTFDASSRVQLGVELTLAQMNAVGVSGALLTTSRPEYVSEAIRQYPQRFACLEEWERGPGDPQTEELLSDMRKQTGTLGTRLLASWPPENAERLRDGSYHSFFSAAEKLDIPVALFVSGVLSAALPIAQAYPNLTLVIDHFGHMQPPFQERGTTPLDEVDELLKLAACPNVFVKISGGPTLSFDPYPYNDLKAPISRIIEAFGPSRLMWGSDITRINGVFRCPAISEDDFRMTDDYPGKHDYAESLYYLLHHYDLSNADKEAIFGGSLRRAFRWNPTG